MAVILEKINELDSSGEVARKVYDNDNRIAETAEAAEKFASDASEKANVAAQLAGTAKTTADTAKSTADDALTKADSAIQTANKASEKADTKTDLTNLVNISQAKNNFAYLDNKAARAAVTADIREKGQVVVFRLSTGDWFAEQFIGANITDWGNDKSWQGFGSGGKGLLNVSEDNGKYDYSSKQEARNAVEERNRSRGQVITYQLISGEWVLDMFIGDSTGSWGNSGSWRSFVTESEMKQIQTDIQSIDGEVKVLKQEVATKADNAYTYEEGETTYLQLTNNGEDVGDPIPLPAGGGGGTGSGITMRVRPVGLTSFTAGENTDVLIKYSFTSIESDTGEATGPGTFIVNVNGANVSSGVANQGENEFNLKGYIFLGSNTVKIKVIDSEGNTKTVQWNITVASLTIASPFADDIVYNTNPVPFRYTPSGLGEKTTRFFLDGEELAPDVTETSGRQITKNLTGLRNGSHSLRVFTESTVSGSSLRSNELYYEFIFADASAQLPVIALSYNRTEVEQFSMIDIPFLVYNPASPTANVTIRVNGQLAAQMEAPRTKQHFTYQANSEGTLTIVFTVGAVSKTLTIQVNASGLDIYEELADLEYKAFATGKSNSSADRDKWDYNGHTATFTGFSWSDDGWQKDDAGNNCLKLLGDSKVDIDIKPFANNILTTGMTLTVEYSTKEVTDDQAVIMSTVFAGIGVEFTPTSVTLKSAQTEVTTRFDSSKKISISLVVEKLAENKLVSLYVDGINSGTKNYPENDNFTQSTAVPFSIGTGARSCQLQVYGIRWYRNSLNDSQILGNFIFDIENLEDKMIVYTRNQIIDAFGNIDYNKALEYLDCMVIIGELPNYKGDKKDNGIILESRRNPALSFSAIGEQAAQNDVQGTSSQFYPRKNFKFKLKNGYTYTESGIVANKYPLRGTGIPANVFCLKADFAESSGTHNTGIAVLIDQMLKEYGILTPPQTLNDNVRTTIDGYPILVFHRESESAQAQFVGKYNFNYDKAAEEVFGFEEGDICVEFRNNTSNLCLFKNADFSNWENDLEFRYPDGGTDITPVIPIWEWIVSCVGNPDKFKAECANYFDVQNLLFTFINVEALVRTDQAAKNQFFTIFKKDGKGRFIDYDNDTALGINNEGDIAFSPYVEFEDQVASGYVWNGWDSELWRLVRAAYPNEIKAMYQDLRQKQVLTPAKVLDILQAQQADKWCEVVYNLDGQFKYIDPLTVGYWDYSGGTPEFKKTGAYLYALQGSRTRHRTWYVGERFKYTDAKYDAGSYINDTLSMRLYTPTAWGGVTPNADFKLTMAKDGYPRILFGSVRTEGVRAKAGQTLVVAAPADVQLNDTETVVYGASNIRSLGDLSGKYLGTVDISNGTALEDIIVGSTKTGYQNLNLKTLHTGSNGRLSKVNVANCPELKESLDFGLCYSLREVEARGSGITGMSLPKSGVLEKLYLPASYAAVVLKNQPYLNVLTLEGYGNLNTVIIENVPGIDGYELVKNAVASAGSKLSKVRLIGIDTSDMNSATLNAIAQMTGEDENGLPTDTAVVTGKIVINQITQGALDRFTLLFPHLEITPVNILEVIDFEDNIVKEIMVANFDSNGDGEISPTEVVTSVITEGLLTDSGAKSFNEAHYWRGSSTNKSRIYDVDTLESVSLLTGRTLLKDLPQLKQLIIQQGPDDSLDAEPLLRTDRAITNCYNIEKWILSGRYIENSLKGVIMGRRTNPNGTFYEVCFPMKGFTDITIDEPCKWNDNIEPTYPHGRYIETITLNAAVNVYMGSLASLHTLNIHGVGWASTLDLGIIANRKNLSYVNIDGSKNPGRLGNIAISAPNPIPLYLTIGEGITSGVSSAIRIGEGNGTNTIVPLIDLGTGIGSTITVYYNRGWDGSINCPAVSRLIIRNPNNVLPLTTNGSGSSPSSGFPTAAFSAIYVPDDLVTAYKAATNWSNYAAKIQPLSLLG